MKGLRLLTQSIVLYVILVGLVSMGALAAEAEKTERPIYDLSQKDQRLEVGDDLRNGYELPGKFNPPPRKQDWEIVAEYALKAEASQDINSKEMLELEQVVFEVLCRNGIDSKCVAEVLEFREWLESSMLIGSGRAGNKPGGPGGCDPLDPTCTNAPQQDLEVSAPSGNVCTDPYWEYEYVSATSQFRVIRPLEVLTNREVLIHPVVTVTYQPRLVKECNGSTVEIETPPRRTTNIIQIISVSSTPSSGLLRAEVVPNDVGGDIYRAGDIRVIWNEPHDKYQLIVKYYPVIEGNVHKANGEMVVSQTYVWELANGKTTDGIKVIDSRSKQTN